MILPARAGISRILDNADDLVVSRGIRATSEVMPNRILVRLEQLVYKGLVHDGDGRRGWRILHADSAAHQHVGSD